MGEMMVKNQSKFINLLPARQTAAVFPMVADVQRWGVMDSSSSSEDELGVDETMSSSSSFEENSSSSGSSNSSAEDDASSPSEAASPAAAQRLPRGPLYGLSELMNELPPVKRGLSKHFQGKSQSFTSLFDVHALEDLAKRENPYKKKQMMAMKSCKSCACGLDNSKSSFATNNSSKIISKKGGNKGGSFSSLLGSKRNGLMSCSISPPPILE